MSNNTGYRAYATNRRVSQEDLLHLEELEKTVEAMAGTFEWKDVQCFGCALRPKEIASRTGLLPILMVEAARMLQDVISGEAGKAIAVPVAVNQNALFRISLRKRPEPAVLFLNALSRVMENMKTPSKTIILDMMVSQHVKAIENEIVNMAAADQKRRTRNQEEQVIADSANEQQEYMSQR